MGIVASLRDKLTKSRNGLFGTIKNIFSSHTIITDELYEELEETLVSSDVGYDMTMRIVTDLTKAVKKQGITDVNDIYPTLKNIMNGYVSQYDSTMTIESGRMNVILVVGVNGVGKTTTIGKLAAKYANDGKKVLLGACDTFRAAAIEQLTEWANRSHVDIVASHQGADPGSVVFDTLTKGISGNYDIVILDTAGRLHNKANLMEELGKIKNIIKKKIGDAAYETLLVVDGTTGQNAINQAKIFDEVMNLTGFIVTKLDGTAKGGIIFSLTELLHKPVKFIGVGESLADLRDFEPQEYVDAMFDL